MTTSSQSTCWSEKRSLNFLFRLRQIESVPLFLITWINIIEAMGVILSNYSSVFKKMIVMLQLRTILASNGKTIVCLFSWQAAVFLQMRCAFLLICHFYHYRITYGNVIRLVFNLNLSYYSTIAAEAKRMKLNFHITRMSD